MTEHRCIAEEVAERWLARTLASYPATTRASLGASADQFRNPAGHVLRENLRILAGELLGSMNPESLHASLDAIVRLRAVQGFSPSDALRFVLELRQAAADVPGATLETLQARIDELVLMAFDQYMSCREQIFSLRAREIRFRAQYDVQPE